MEGAEIGDKRTLFNTSCSCCCLRNSNNEAVHAGVKIFRFLKPHIVPKL